MYEYVFAPCFYAGDFLVISDVYKRQPLGRSELARRLSLAPATLTRISTDLIASGLLTEVRSTRTGASGRPSIPLAVVPDSHHFLGIKVADDCLTAAVIDLKAQVLSYDQLPLPMHSPTDVVEGISSLASQAEKTFRIDAIGAVSYTHLDVYKRQLASFA